jgi:hypothetical protein
MLQWIANIEYLIVAFSCELDYFVLSTAFHSVVSEDVMKSYDNFGMDISKLTDWIATGACLRTLRSTTSFSC